VSGLLKICGKRTNNPCILTSILFCFRCFGPLDKGAVQKMGGGLWAGLETMKGDETERNQ